jgi:hypothetical protein
VFENRKAAIIDKRDNILNVILVFVKIKNFGGINIINDAKRKNKNIKYKK